MGGGACLFLLAWILQFWLLHHPLPPSPHDSLVPHGHYDRGDWGFPSLLLLQFSFFMSLTFPLPALQRSESGNFPSPLNHNGCLHEMSNVHLLCLTIYSDFPFFISLHPSEIFSEVSSAWRLFTSSSDLFASIIHVSVPQSLLAFHHLSPVIITPDFYFYFSICYWKFLIFFFYSSPLIPRV